MTAVERALLAQSIIAGVVARPVEMVMANDDRSVNLEFSTEGAWPDASAELDKLNTTVIPQLSAAFEDFDVVVMPGPTGSRVTFTVHLDGKALS